MVCGPSRHGAQSVNNVVGIANRAAARRRCAANTVIAGTASEPPVPGVDTPGPPA